MFNCQWIVFGALFATVTAHASLRDWNTATDCYFGRLVPGDAHASFTLAIRGGNNGNQKRCGDLGSYAILLDGWQVVGDAGSARSVPRFRDCQQKLGSAFYSQMMYKEFSPDRDTLIYDLTPAYCRPKVYEVVRTFTYDRRERSVTVEDYVDTKSAFFETALVFGKDARIEKGTDPLHFVLKDEKSGRRAAVAIAGSSENKIGVTVAAEDIVEGEAKVGTRLVIRFAAEIERGAITVTTTAL